MILSRARFGSNLDHFKLTRGFLSWFPTPRSPPNAIYDDPRRPFANIASVVDRIDTDGAVAVPFIDAYRALDLRWACESLPFVSQPETVGFGRVRQQVEICPSSYLSATHPILTVARRISDDLSRALDTLPKHPLAMPFAPNDIVLQRYPQDSIGITPHHDGSSRVNVVCVLVLWGDGTFALCDDRAGTNPRPVFAPPGRLILLKAPGFRGADRGPFHFVSGIRRGRLVLHVRERLLPR